MRRNQTDSVIAARPARRAARRDVKASSRPSGLQRGAEDALAGLVSRRGGAEPSAGTIQISLCRRFSASTMNDADEGDGAAVGRDRGAVDGLDPVVVGQLHRTGGRLRGGRRTARNDEREGE